MPEPKEVTRLGLNKEQVTYARKFDLGNYQSLDLGCTLWAKVPDNMDHDTFMRTLWNIVKAATKFAYSKTVHNFEDDTIFDGLANISIETISVTASRKVNTGQKYENATVANSLWYNLDTEEEWAKVIPALWRNVFANIASALPGASTETPLGLEEI